MELEQLIATEQRLDEALRRARVEAARIVEQAQEAARRAESALAADLEAAVVPMAVSAATERRDREAEIAREAAEHVARADSVTTARVRLLAQEMANRLIAEQDP